MSHYVTYVTHMLHERACAVYGVSNQIKLACVYIGCIRDYFRMYYVRILRILSGVRCPPSPDGLLPQK